MKKFTIALLVFLVMSCVKTTQKQPDNSVVGIEEKNNNYEIIDWDKLISIMLEEYINNNREDQYDENGYTIYEKYISNTKIASLDIIFRYYTTLDEFFSPDEKETLIKKLREEYTTFDYDDVFNYFPDTEFSNLSIENEFIINTWKMITALFSIFYYSSVLNEYISAEDKDRIGAKALLDFLKTEVSWSIDINSLAEFFPFPFVRFKSQMDNIRTYNIERFNNNSELQTTTIIHYKTKTGSINAVYIGFLDDFEYSHNQLGFNLFAGLYLVLELEDDAYIFVDGSIYTGETFYTAIKVFDEKIEPYPVFNGFNTLSFTSTHWSLGKGICGSGFGPNSYDIHDKSPFWIGINYNGRERIYENLIFPDWDTLTFIFNGSEFLGDYDLFNELIKIK